MSEQSFTLPSSLPGVTNRVKLEKLSGGRHRIDVQTETAIPQALLDRCAARQAEALANNHGRAPMGDSHGAWQHVADLPLQLLFDHLMKHSPEAIEQMALRGVMFTDEKSLKKLVNDSDYKRLRTDVPERRF